MDRHTTDWVLGEFAALGPGFYGNLTFELVDGQIVRALVTQSKKPPKGTSRKP